MCLHFWKFENFHEITWNFAQMTESVFFADKKYLVWITLHASSSVFEFHLYGS